MLVPPSLRLAAASTERRILVDTKDMAQQYYGLSRLPKKPVAAMAYVPFQKNDSEIFTPAQGFALGTMFPELNKPFYGSKCGGSDD